MDPITIVGIVGGFICVVGTALMEGTKIAALLQLPAAVLVIGGTAGATVACYSMKQIMELLPNIKLAIKKQEIPVRDVIEMFAELATITRKEGILALENHKPKVSHPTLTRGLRLIIDGTDPTLVKDMLSTEIALGEEEIKAYSAIFQTAGGFAPTLGIIGTVVGLVGVLGNLEDTSKLGEHIAMAFIATLYGIAVANLVLLPMSKKLAFVAKEETLIREMILEGVLSLYSGDNPHIIQEKLLSFLSEKGRQEHQASQAARAGATKK